MNKTWSPWQKMLCRFFIVFLFLFSLIAYNPVFRLMNTTFDGEAAFFGHLKGVVTWFDSHIFHVGYIPSKHTIYVSDTHFGVVLTLVIFFTALVAMVIWTLLDKRTTNYNRLYYWFSNYMAYYIFLAMTTYAIIKIIPIQGIRPRAPDLLLRWGDLRNWEILFRFMGASPAYCMFSGWLELIASALLIFNRTRIIGGVLMIVMLVNIVCLNIFYNNSVILLSALLLLCTIFIMARALPKLYAIFIKLQPVSLVQYRYTFNTPWKKYIMILLCFLPAWKLYSITSDSWKYYKRELRNQQQQRLYAVTLYQHENDSIPPLTTDTLRWKYVCFLDFSPSNRQMVKFDMQDKTTNYRCRWDSVHRTVTFIDRKDTTLKNVFSFTTLPNGDMNLQGNWLGKKTGMQLSNMPIDSMTLVKDKFLFMQEEY